VGPDNIASGVAAHPAGMLRANAYATSKAVLEAHTVNLAAELDGTGVTVNAFQPGRSTPPCRLLSADRTPLHGVAALSARNAWAAGTSSSGDTVILHWVGRRRRRTPSPSPPTPGEDFLGALSASSVDNAWAVGSNTGEILAEHWDGASWQVVPIPLVESVRVSVLPSGHAWAAGSPPILHWNGTAWHRVPLT